MLVMVLFYKFKTEYYNNKSQLRKYFSLFFYTQQLIKLKKCIGSVIYSPATAALSLLIMILYIILILEMLGLISITFCLKTGSWAEFVQTFFYENLPPETYHCIEFTNTNKYVQFISTSFHSI